MNPPSLELKSELQTAYHQFEAFMARFFSTQTERFSYGPIFEPLYCDLAEYVCRRGKRIRPLLLLSGYRTFGGTRSLTDEHLLTAALSMELLHAFILIHDDIIDQSDRRRNLPTLHKVLEERVGKIPGAARIGQNVALVIGDILFALAIETLRSADFPPAARDAALSRFLRDITETGVGEISDILFGVRDIARITRSDISQMYLLKTTRYTFEAPLIIGGLLAGADAAILDPLAKAIEPMGMAFQIENDLNEYRQFKADRMHQSDLLEGKKTYLMRVAFERLDDVDQSILQLCLSAIIPNDASMGKIEQLIDKSGATAVLAQEMEQLFNKSVTMLQSIESLSPDQRETLLQTFHLIRKSAQCATAGPR